jgi:Gpi18-like mannosyltransferase
MRPGIWRQEILPPLLVIVLTRVALFLVVWVSLRAVPRLPLYPAQIPDDFLPGHPMLDGWARWDAAHYVAIALHGYGSQENPSPHDGYGFLPIFPLLVRAVGSLPGLGPNDATFAVAGIALANVFLLVSAALFVLLARSYLSRRDTMNAVLLYALGPFSFFFSAAYSESLFLTLILGSLVLADRGRWLHAGAVGAVASGTRIAGLALVPALLYGAYRDGVRGWQLVATGMLPAGGFALWSAYAAWKTGNALAYGEAQATWGGWNEHVQFYAELLWNEPATMLRGDSRHLVILIGMAVALLYLALLPRVWRLTSPAVALFTLVIVVGHVAWTWVSLGRYLLPAVGVYIAGGALLGHPRVAGWPRDVAIASAAIVLTALAILFAHGFWVV